MSSVLPSENPALELSPGIVLRNTLNGSRYRIVKPLGAGGFGRAYAAIPLHGDLSARRLCCLKVTIDLTGWHGEAYFGHVLRHAPSVLRIQESFAWIRPGKTATPVYCLVTEFAEGGDLGSILANIRTHGQRRKPGRRSSAY